MENGLVEKIEKIQKKFDDLSRRIGQGRKAVLETRIKVKNYEVDPGKFLIL